MTKRMQTPAALAAMIAMCWAGTPLHAASKSDAVALTKCTASLGTIAVVDGDTQGWTKFGLNSPRDLIAGMAAESGCFTLHNAASGRPADFLVTAIAGDKEEIDRGMELAKTAVIEGALRSGAMGQIAGRVPVVGGMLGMFGGLGGKKKTVAAGLKVISPATGQVIATGSGQMTKSSLSMGGIGAAMNPYAAAAHAQIAAMGYGDYTTGGYATTRDGKMLASAFAQAFNNLVAQSAALAAVRPVATSIAPTMPAAAVAAPAAPTLK